MKLLKVNLLGMVTACLLLFVTVNSSIAQASVCDPCTASWGPVQQMVYTGQTVQGLPPTCTFSIFLDIQTRICNGVVQVRLLSHTIAQEGSDPSCNIYCHHAWYLMQKAAKLLLQDLGGHIVMNKPSSCYYIVEFEPTPQFKNCIGSEINNFSNWYSALPCGKSCCLTEYELLASGEVMVVNSLADPCMGTPPTPLPPSITLICNGVSMVVPVIPPTQPITCENVCDNSGDIFSAKIVGTDDDKLEKENYIYPNPAGTTINISNWKEWTDVKIYDVVGKLVLDSKLKKMSLDISTLSKGYYQLILVNDDLRNVQSFIKE